MVSCPYKKMEKNTLYVRYDRSPFTTQVFACVPKTLDYRPFSLYTSLHADFTLFSNLGIAIPNQCMEYHLFSMHDRNRIALDGESMLYGKPGTSRYS